VVLSGLPGHYSVSGDAIFRTGQKPLAANGRAGLRHLNPLSQRGFSLSQKAIFISIAKLFLSFVGVVFSPSAILFLLGESLNEY